MTIPLEICGEEHSFEYKVAFFWWTSLHLSNLLWCLKPQAMHTSQQHFFHDLEGRITHFHHKFVCLQTNKRQEDSKTYVTTAREAFTNYPFILPVIKNSSLLHKRFYILSKSQILVSYIECWCKSSFALPNIMLPYPSITVNPSDPLDQYFLLKNSWQSWNMPKTKNHEWYIRISRFIFLGLNHNKHCMLFCFLWSKINPYHRVSLIDD